MKRERIIYIGVLLMLFTGVFLVHRFYFAAKLERYAQHKQLLNGLRDTEARLKSTFGTAQPDDVIRDHSGKVEAWNDAIAARVPFFSDADWRDHPKPPSDVFILQFWYGDTTQNMVRELWEKAVAKYGPQVLQRMPQDFPNSVQAMFGVAYAEQWQGLSINTDLVNTQLEQLAYGISALEMLMDKNALQISHARIEELGAAGFARGGLKYTRLHLSFMMEARDLVGFLEELRRADRFYSIEGMRVSHPYVLARYEPQLQVDMYLLRTKQEGGGFGADAAIPSAADAYQGSFGGQDLTPVGVGRGAAMTVEETGAFATAWKWFKRNVLFTN